MTPRTLDLLDGLEAGESSELVALAERLRCASGDVLFRLGDEADRLFVVESGCVSLTLPMQVDARSREVLIEERLPGQTVGWSGIVAPHRFTLTATAAVDSDLLAFPRERLLRHFAARPEIGYRVMNTVAAVVSQRLHVLQAMWAREMQRSLQARRHVEAVGS